MSDHYCCKRCGQRYDECACSTTTKIEKPVYKLTDWFPCFTPPVRNGWYESRTSNITDMKFFCNGWWFWDDRSKSAAITPHEWRGQLK